MNAPEGVTKFSVEHRTEPLSPSVLEALAPLSSWRRVLFELGLIGRDPARYEGAGFGNVSLRLPPWGESAARRRFLISGTQTGGLPELGAEQVCVVEFHDAEANRVVSRGPMPPSSEALTHGAMYGASPSVRCVLHGHSPELWRHAEALRLPTTSARVEYGTPAMAQEVARVYRSTRAAELGVMIMGGHEDGVLSFGRSPEEAGLAMARALARAYSLAGSSRLTTIAPDHHS